MRVGKVFLAITSAFFSLAGRQVARKAKLPSCRIVKTYFDKDEPRSFKRIPSKAHEEHSEALTQPSNLQAPRILRPKTPTAPNNLRAVP